MNLADELRKLAELREAGHLTDQEFADAKGRLIADAGAAPPPLRQQSPAAKRKSAACKLQRGLRAWKSFAITLAIAATEDRLFASVPYRHWQPDEPIRFTVQFLSFTVECASGYQHECTARSCPCCHPNIRTEG